MAPYGAGLSPPRGWTVNRGHTAATYVDRTGTPLGGIVKLRARVRGSIPDHVTVSVRGKQATYPVLPADAPVQATVVLGGTVSSLAGECGETEFTPAQCTFRREPTQLFCRR